MNDSTSRCRCPPLPSRSQHGITARSHPPPPWSGAARVSRQTAQVASGPSPSPSQRDPPAESAIGCRTHGAGSKGTLRTRGRAQGPGRAGRSRARWNVTPPEVLHVVSRAKSSGAVHSGCTKVLVSEAEEERSWMGADRLPYICFVTPSSVRALAIFEHLAPPYVCSPFARRLRPPPLRAAARRAPQPAPAPVLAG